MLSIGANAVQCFPKSLVLHLDTNSSEIINILFVPFCRGADKSLARPTSRCTLFDGENISFDASLVIYWVSLLEVYKNTCLCFST
jgi:hypothetical protein